MKTKILLLLLTFTVVFSIQNSFGQSDKSTLAKLMSSTWELYHLRTSSYRIFEEYKTDVIVSTLMYDGQKNIMNCAYYLSDTIETVFDPQKVGKTTEGKYITVELKPQAEDAPKIAVYEILEIAENKMRLRGIYAQGEGNIWNSSTIPND